VGRLLEITERAKVAGAKIVWDCALAQDLLPIAMEPAKGVQIDAVVVSPHKFIGGPAASGIQAVGASLLYLPTYSPDFNPIEMAFPHSRRCCALPRRARCTIFGKQ
jgi:selenocysteine lyase/cysteine desulfurase